MLGFEITFDNVPEGEQTNRFLFYTNNVFCATKWARTLGAKFKIQETKNVPVVIRYGEVIDLEKELPKKKYIYYYVEASGSAELTDRFIVRVEEKDDSHKYVKQLLEVSLDIENFEIKKATIEDVITSLLFEQEIADLCSSADLKRGE